MGWVCQSCGLENTDETSRRCYCGADMTSDETQSPKKIRDWFLRLVIAIAVIIFLGMLIIFKHYILKWNLTSF